jgi:rhamnose utilization protein RhaD (predicted bifunctional aldolase and dehydrogenase)
VVCGKVPVVIPYIDPGLQLALTIRDELRRYRDTHGRPPKLLLMVNHGPVALGQTATEVMNITLMANKWAQVVWGTYALGGPHFMSEKEAERIDNRLDEHHRRKQLTGA